MLLSTFFSGSLKEFDALEFQKYHYLNFEESPGLVDIFNDDLDPKKLIAKIEISQDIEINTEEDLLIFDEIQDCPRAITSPKYFCEHLPAK